MKRASLLLIAPAALLLGACASPPTRPADPAGADAAFAACATYDCERMARQSAAARARGVKLIWINPPTKAPPAAG